MPLKKTVAAERRMDLASFFCMIGRHGPAVALAVVAVVTVLAGFYIYRTVTGRRRKDGDGSVVRRGRCGSGGAPTGKRARRGGGMKRAQGPEMRLGIIYRETCSRQLFKGL